MLRVMENAVDRRSKLAGHFSRDLPAGVAVAVKAREVAAGNFQADAVARQEHIRRGPQVESDLVDSFWFEQFRRRE